MIQQVNLIPVPQKTQPQATQPKENTSDFETLMKKTAAELNSKAENKAGPAKRKEDGEKDSTQQNGSPDESVEGVDISSLAAMLQQTIGTPLNVVEMQSAGKHQLPILQVVSAPDQTAASPSTVQKASSLVGTMAGKTVGVQANSSQPGVQQNPVFAITNTANDASAVQQINSSNSNAVQTLNGGNAAVPTEISKAPQQGQFSALMEQSNASSEQSIQSISGGQQQDVLQAKPSADSSLQSVFGARQTVKQVEQNVDVSSKSAFEAQQVVLTAEEKISTPVQEAAYQNQTPARFSDLFKTDNVVIKVSDASSNVAKATCNQVADKIAVNFKAGNPEFQMDLYPQDLGKVSVKLAMQSGVLTVEVLASNPKTQSMLMANTNEIKSMLQTTVSQPVQILEPAQDKPWYQQQNQPQQQSQQQQQQEQQNRNTHSYLNALDSDTTTDDFLSVMQQLRQQAYSL